MAKETEATVRDLRKLAAAKAKAMEKDAKELKLVREKLIKLEAEYIQILEEVMQNAKKSAATTILQSMILMAEQAVAQGFEVKVWGLEA
jgi:hypothetical protein